MSVPPTTDIATSHMPPIPLNMNLQRRRIGLAEMQVATGGWSTNVTVGGQIVSLLVDTGSSISWILDSRLAMNGTGGTYDYNQSTSAKLGKSDTGFISKYVNGASVSGVIVEDTVTVGNSTVDSLLFGVANKSAASFIGKTTSGILGLGFPSANRIGLSDDEPTFFSKLVPTLEYPVFSVDLRKTNSAANDSATIEFGTLDRTKFLGDMGVAPVNSSYGFWTVDDVGFDIGGVPTNFSQSLLFDTGTDGVLYLNASLVKIYYEQVSGWAKYQSYYIVPCSATLPAFTMLVGNDTAVLEGSDLIIPTANMTNNDMLYCLSILQPGHGIVGTPFFDKNYVVFNQSGPSISFAPFA